MPFATLLAIDGIDLGDYSVRDLTMTLEPIKQATVQDRTVNGELVDLSEPQFHDKYKALISCTDHESPIFVGVRPGTKVTVTCVPHLGTRGEDTSGNEQQLVLEMMVQSWQVARREWRAEDTWSLPLEEV